MASRPRTRLHPDLRREQILDSAARRFREQGYAEVTLEDLAAAAGVTRGLLHHYFGSKRSLYLEVLERAVAVPEGTALVPEGTDGDLTEVLGVCVEAWMRMIEASGGLWSGVTGTAGIAGEDVDAVLVRARDSLVERMITELPFPEDLDRDLLRSALRTYAAMARVVSEEWLVVGALRRDQAATFLHTSLLALVEIVVPALGDVSRTPRH